MRGISFNSLALTNNNLALTIGVVALLAGCGALPFGSAQGRLAQPPSIAAPASRLPAGRPGNMVTETVMYSFAGGKDGAIPEAAPVSINGELYGTTALGGDAGCSRLPGCGTVYKLSGSGQESVLHAFTSIPDGEAPQGLLTVGGKLYGPSVYGGVAGCKSGEAKGCGTVFETTLVGKERVLYRFGGKTQGASPVSQLTFFKGAFYGEAASGGVGTCYFADYPGCGLIFKMSPAGKAGVLYTFKGGKSGGNPQGGLFIFKGNFFGTTSGGGGGGGCGVSYLCGTAFKMTPSGRVTVLHEFGRSPYDGASPQTGLVAINGVLYGTTFTGGANSCAFSGSPYGCGTVFSLTLSGYEKVIYSFRGSDGYFPNGLIAVGGKLYGTTRGRGFYLCGTLFELTPSGHETTLYQFKGGTDGCGPSSGLTDVDGTLYGTTSGGGAHGEGTLYSVNLKT
ncbi:MAG TPA: choice-of-anchor tandem repeat GloVer-containing protein [Candidatus Cybelea sp.]|jgi:uncharacterized repeat protein (TIGR03803 family)